MKVQQLSCRISNCRFFTKLLTVRQNKMKVFLLIVLLLFSLDSYSQQAKRKAVFYSNQQACHVIYTSSNDFILELFSDSTFRLSQIDWKPAPLDSQYIVRVSFFGSYTYSQDTILVTYRHSSIEKKPINSDLSYQYAEEINPKETPPRHFYFYKEGLVSYPISKYWFQEASIEIADRQHGLFDALSR
jgi:hypothetical protein